MITEADSMTPTLDPARIAARGRGGFVRLACPRAGCGATVIVERISGTPTVDRYLARCSQCDWSQTVESPQSGEPRTVDDVLAPPSKRLRAARWGKEPLPPRPICAVPGCRKRAEERRLCSDHHSAWRVAGRPADVDAWIIETFPAAEPPRRRRPSQPAPRFVETAMPRTGKRPVCVCLDCGQPAVAHQLCKSHYGRWRNAGKPSYEDFLRSDAAGPVRHHRSRKSAAPTQSTAPVTANAVSPITFEPRVEKVKPSVPSVFSLPAGDYSLLLIGSFATLCTATGRVVRQVPLEVSR